MTAMKAPTTGSYRGHLWITVSLRRLVWTRPAALTSVAARLAQSSPFVTGASRAVTNSGQPTSLGYAAPPYLADDPDVRRRKTLNIMILTTQVPWN